MKPVAFIVEASSLSGGVRIIFEMASRLKKRGHKVHIWSLGTAPNWFDIGDVHWAQFPNYETMITFMKKDGRGFAKVATWWRTAEVLSRDEGSLDRGEGFYLIQDAEWSYYTRPFEREQVARTYSIPLKKFTPNLWVTTVLENVTHIGQAYSTQQFFRMKYAYPADRVALAVMRRQALKGFSSLGEFSRRLRVLDPKAELYTLGVDNGTRLAGSHTAHFVNLSDQQVCQKYNEATVFISCSWHEGFSLTLLEAMACGTPTVCFKAEGNEVFCENNVNCLMFEKGDVANFTAGSLEVMKDKKLAKRLVEGGLATAKKYANWDSVIDKLEVVLSE